MFLYKRCFRSTLNKYNINKTAISNTSKYLYKVSNILSTQKSPNISNLVIGPRYYSSISATKILHFPDADLDRLNILKTSKSKRGCELIN